MRLQFFTLSLLLFFTTTLFAQPANDDCDGLIDLGVLPACPDDIFDNVDATASDIGFGNIPNCFEGGTVQNDVWFAFTTNDTLIDITITVEGTTMGTNGPIVNPQIAIYRGDCSFNNLADLGICASADDGESLIAVDVIGLTPNTTYFIRINDYSATAAPNWGDFQLCIEEYVPAINIGDQPSSTSCFGTLYDSGGPDEDYGSNENLTFTIQPAEFFACLEISIVDFQLENGFDFLNFYAGTTTADPLIASLTGAGNGEPFIIQSTTPITVQFTSDFSGVQAGFEFTWQCSGLACDGSSFDNPTEISGLPLDEGGFSTCEAAATFATTPCGPLNFVNGPEYVFAYTSTGGYCAEVAVTGADAGTGVLILNGPLDDPDTECVGQSESGTAFGVDFNIPGVYYIVVANAGGCTDFGLSITESECNLNPTLSGALCNPLNGCIDPTGLPSVFNFNQGFQDIAYNQGVNSGCWLNTGAAQPNYYWFTIEAQAAGPFGFTVQAANPAEASDIDFSVWGPFDPEEVCEDPDAIIDFVENNQPIRSSWAGGADPTGLASIHPVTGIDVTDEFDCGDPSTPGAGGDDFVSVIDCEPGQVFAVLINDWGNDIESGAIEVDWSASADSVLAPIPPIVATADTAICEGETVQLLVESSVENITWLKDTATLSCTYCLDPIASPEESTLYVAVVDAVCYQDTIEVLVEVYDIDAGPDITVCTNEEIQIVAGSDFLSADYNWTAPTGISLSCTDCPNPFVTADVAGTYELSVSLSGPACILMDTMELTVLPETAAEYNISDDQQICLPESTFIGGDEVAGVSYTWTADGFTSDEANPEVAPDTTTMYYLSASNGICPIPSLDSVLVEVFIPPTISISGDTAVCQEEPIVLGSTEIEPGVTYTWTGPDFIEDPSNPNSVAFPQSEGTYTLTAVRGACEEVASFDITITPIAIDVLAEDTLTICRGEEVLLDALVVPADSIASWTSTQPGFVPVTANQITVAPESVATYYAEVAVLPGCFKLDSVVILVDSLPYDLSIMPADTSVCEGELVILTTNTYEPSDFPGIEFLWQPEDGQETPDSLLNMVVSAMDTITYERISTSGVCIDTSYATVNIITTPEVTILPGDTIICPGESVQINAEVSDDTDTFEWTSGAESLSCTDCLDPLASPSGTTTYTLRAENVDCPNEESLTITVIPLPTYDLTSQNFLCEGESLVLNTVSDGVSTYIWTSTDPGFGTVTNPMPEVTPSETTTYFLAITNGICDTIFDELTIEVVQQPVLTVSSDALTICEGESVTLTADVANATPDDTYEWEDSNGNSVGSTAEITISPDDSDTYTVYYISGAGCGSLNDNVFIEVQPAPTVDIADDAVICLGESVQLNLASDNMTAYSWSSTDPNFTDVNNPEPVVTPAQTATYTLLASNGICDDVEESVTVEVVGEVTLNINGPSGLICSGDEVTLIAEAIGGSSNDVFEWTANGETITGDSIVVTPLETTTYMLNYEDGAGCQMLTDSITINVEEGVDAIGIEVVGLDGDEPYLLGQNIQLTALYNTTITEGLVFSWFLDTTMIASGPGLAIIETQVLQDGDLNYSVLIETPTGCSETINVNVTVELPKLGIPNIFTPNGDETNDFFNVAVAPEEILPLLEIVEFKVYNRWGQLVYDNETPDTGWDGKFNDKPQPIEAYFYSIKVAYLNGESAGEFQGNVTLAR